MSKTGVVNQPGSNGKKLGGATGKGFMPGKSGNPNGRPSAGMAHAEWLRANLFDVPIPAAELDKLPLPIQKRIRELPGAIKGRIKTFGNLGDAMDFMDWLMGDSTKGTTLKDRGYGKCPQPITGDLALTATVSLAEWSAKMNGRVLPRAGE